MKNKQKREKQMYFISDTEYIYFPLIVRSKTYSYFTTYNNKNQWIYSLES